MDEGIDEFLAHMLTIEAALGRQEDRNDKRHGGLGGCVKLRLQTLLGGAVTKDDHGKLADARSEYVHGRKMSVIPSDVRTLARSAARKVVVALVDMAGRLPGSMTRTAVLDALLAGRRP